MNEVFCWTRFCNVVRKDFSSIWQQAGTTLPIIALLPAMVWLLLWVMGGLVGEFSVSPEVRWFFTACVVCLAVMVTPSRMYRTCNLQKEGIYFAMLPASKLEKYLSMLLFSIVVCPLFCLVGSIVVDYFLTMLPFGPYRKWMWQTDDFASLMEACRRWAAEDAVGMGIVAKVLTPGHLVLSGMLSYLNLVAVFLFTTTIFKKHKVVQTLPWLLLINFAVNIIVTIVRGVIVPNDESVFMWIDEMDVVRGCNVGYWLGNAWTALLTAVLLWWTYYRLKKMKY